MPVLSRISPSKVALLATTLPVARQFKSATNRTRFLLSVLLGYLAYTKKAPPVLEGANPPGSPRSYPWLGHLYLYPSVKDQFHESMLRISRDTNFTSFSLCMPENFRVLVLHDENDRRYVLKTHFSNFSKNFDEKFGVNKVST